MQLPPNCPPVCDHCKQPFVAGGGYIEELIPPGDVGIHPFVHGACLLDFLAGIAICAQELHREDLQKN